MIIDIDKNDNCEIEKAEYEEYPNFSSVLKKIGCEYKSIIYYKDIEIYNGKYMRYKDQIEFIEVIIKRDEKIIEILNDKDI